VRAIGTIVALLILGLGVAMYIVTRPPNRELDAVGRTWVRDYEAWTDTTRRQIRTAEIGLGFSSEARNTRLLDPLRTCSFSFVRIGPPPTLLGSVEEAVIAACGEAEYAVQVNERFGAASLATTKLHLGEADDRLRLSRRILEVELGETDEP
jgi:hypothetical protein